MKTIRSTILVSLLGFLLNQQAQAQEVTQTYQGKTLNANIEYADGKAFGDKVVLLLHGTLTHNGRSMYADLQQNLVKQGVSSLSMNLSLGVDNRHGEYDCAVPHTHKHTDAIKEIALWQDWLKQKGVKQITIVGHSRGGNQVAWYMSEHGKDPMIHNAVLLAPATKEQQSAQEYEKKYHQPLAKVLDQANNLVKAGKGNTLMKEVDFIYCPKAQVSADAFVDYYTSKPQFDTPTLLKTAAKPTLVITATEDQAVPELPKRLEEVTSNKQVSVMSIDGSDHFFADLYNEDVATAVQNFMK
jgi:pimeloyl-ACP methyl ester carboxylesterase